MSSAAIGSGMKNCKTLRAYYLVLPKYNVCFATMGRVLSLIESRFVTSAEAEYDSLVLRPHLVVKMVLMAMKTLIVTFFMLEKLAKGQNVQVPMADLVLVPSAEVITARPSLSAPVCVTCGMLMTSNGSCYKCENCGSTSGCS